MFKIFVLLELISIFVSDSVCVLIVEPRIVSEFVFEGRKYFIIYSLKAYYHGFTAF